MHVNSVVSSAILTLATVVLNGVSAAPQATTTATHAAFLGLTLPGDKVKKCATPTATTTTAKLAIACRFACIPPTSACSPGEPTGRTPNPPVVHVSTVANDCTATVAVWHNPPGCTNCPTCTSSSLPALETHATTSHSRGAAVS